MQMRQEEMILHEKAAVQAALANVRAERAEEEEEERLRLAVTRRHQHSGRPTRPVTAPPARTMNRARIWGNDLRHARTDSQTTAYFDFFVFCLLVGLVPANKSPYSTVSVLPLCSLHDFRISTFGPKFGGDNPWIYNFPSVFLLINSRVPSLTLKAAVA